ncbi:hypothetical protein CASFOL_024214 [Castilleja foliolosa]|uniref:ELM2 domain-containing protein n=1 Tax=Castilleja foliolosa TaxID=1961234 RepID=A0ABD3CMN0_9LAMI
MGVKRPLGEENLPELSFKQPKQPDDINQKLTHDLPTDVPRIDCPGEAKSNSCELQVNECFESGEALSASTADKESEASRMRIVDGVENHSETDQTIQLDDKTITLYVDGPLYWTTATSDKEVDAVNEDSTSLVPTFPRYADISLPSRPPKQLEDPYVSSLNSSPMKEVPLGSDHQAELPDWEPNAREQYFSAPNYQTGTCIIPMPDPEIVGAHESTVGHSRPTQCSCADVGSVRCVRRHVREARKCLQDSLGDETFGELGFYSMGEEVAHKWESGDERLFHETIVSCPPSVRPNFWEMLGFHFPSRTKDEIVSYYYNVFMLRWRAIQNRSHLLCADSDDEDMAHGEQCAGICLHGDRDSDDNDNHTNMNALNEEFCIVGEQDEERRDDRDLFPGWVDGCGPGPRNIGGEEGSDSDCGRVNVDERSSFEVDGTGKGGVF